MCPLDFLFKSLFFLLLNRWQISFLFLFLVVVFEEFHDGILFAFGHWFIKGVLLVVGELIGQFLKMVVEIFFLHSFQRISRFNFLKKYNMNFLKENVYVFGQCCYGSLVYTFS